MAQRPEDLPTILERVPGRELFVLQFMDARLTDGKFRKYRVMTIDGCLYPIHLAVSNHWKVHFFSANMRDSAENRAEDRKFLDDMPHTLGARTMRTLEQIRDCMLLEYGGIDFAIDAAGRIVVFETNTAMSIVPPERHEMWAYRFAPVERAEQAVRTMLLGRPPHDTGWP
jgi:hypothetical protein